MSVEQVPTSLRELLADIFENLAGAGDCGAEHGNGGPLGLVPAPTGDSCD